MALATVEIHSFLNAEEMMSSINRWEDCDAIFIEISENVSGYFELAKKLRDKHKHLAIIFLALDNSFVLKGYSIPIFRYLLKYDNDVRLNECVHSLLKEHKIACAIFNLQEYGICQEIKTESIEYITSYGKISIITFYQDCNHTIELIAPLDQLEAKLKPYGFIRMQRGFLVNFQHIVKLSNYKAYMRSGITINARRSSYSTIKSEFERLCASR